MGHYLEWLAERRGLVFGGYDDLWEWSVSDLNGFWRSIVEHLRLPLHGPEGPALRQAIMPGAEWFPTASCNYAEALLDGSEGAEALVSVSQTRDRVALSAGEFRTQVRRLAGSLAALGVGPGDSVAAYLPNISETVVLLAATASLGALFCSAAPEFGPRAVVDRFGQVNPRVLVAIDGYRYGDRRIDRLDVVAELRRALPTLRATVLCDYLEPGRTPPRGMQPFAELLQGPEVEPRAVPFAHPLWVLFSSGTTGLPKPIVHGHGGILVEHAKMLALHHGVRPGDRVAWFSTTGWMMWNYMLTSLALGATVVCFDGDPGVNGGRGLWQLAEAERLTLLGTSAGYLMACRKAGLRPGEECDLSALRELGSTGSPLPTEGFRYVYDVLRPEVHLASVSGGTDVCSAFVGGAPLVPVWPGEISCRCLGAKVEAFDPDGRSVVGTQGELVLSAPLPSMPLGFLGDPDGARYRAAYFADFPGHWRHGDWVTITERGSCVISGRSDATLNRAGVRLGTAEIYAVVEDEPDVVDSLVVHLEDPTGGRGELVLFVVLREPERTDVPALERRLAERLRRDLSPRHVPDQVVVVRAVPRTLSGKKLEVPVKRILEGAAPDAVASRDALGDPAALEPYVAWAARRASARGRSSDAGS